MSQFNLGTEAFDTIGETALPSITGSSSASGPDGIAETFTSMENLVVSLESVLEAFYRIAGYTVQQTSATTTYPPRPAGVPNGNVIYIGYTDPTTSSYANTTSPALSNDPYFEIGTGGSGSSSLTTTAVISTAGTVTGVTGTAYSVTVPGVTINIPVATGTQVRVLNKIPSAGATVSLASSDGTTLFFTGATGNTATHSLLNPGDSVICIADGSSIGII